MFDNNKNQVCGIEEDNGEEDKEIIYILTADLYFYMVVITHMR